jgi:signal transduction histidine kinase
MKMIRRQLGWKLFLSYLIIILVGVVSLMITAELHTPTAIERHVAVMRVAVGENMGGIMADLTQNFRHAVNEILLVAASMAAITAVLVSTFVTRRIVRPIQAMQTASRRIAAGYYEERVQVMGEDELAELAQAFNQMAHQLAQTEARRRRLIGAVAHELRTPLSSIKAAMEGLVDGVLPAEPATFLEVQREAGHLQRLVQDLEELYRAEAGQLPLALEATSPTAFVQMAVTRLALQFEDKGVQLESDLAADLPAVRVDAARMTQVMLNLLGNALQYTPAGGRVTVRAWTAGNELRIAVEDTGIGLTAEQLRHIFERFYRVDQSRARTGGGSGIGLTIARHLVRAHHGRLTATSRGPGEGSSFTISLPTIPQATP